MNTEIQEYLEQKTNLQTVILEFINNEENEEFNFSELMKEIENQQINFHKNEFKAFLYLIFKISNHHYRTTNFFEKIERILLHFKKELQEYFKNDEIFYIFKNNKRLLLFLFEEKLLIPEKSIYDRISESKYIKRDYLCYFYNEFKQFMNFNLKNDLEEKIKNITSNDNDIFEQKRKKGENHNLVSTLIQNDLVDDFIIYINKTNMSLSSKIQRSIFETNTYLLKKEPTIIEYTLFYGSIQILKFLQLEGVEFTSSSWEYAVHGKNPEIIHILEEQHIKPFIYSDVLMRCIKCHHNEFANYIKSTFFEDRISSYSSIFSKSIKSYNYEYFFDDFKSDSILKDLCKYDYCYIVEELLRTGNMPLKDREAYKAASLKQNYELIQILLKYRGIGDQAFEGSQLKRIEIPPFITSIGESAFSECEKLEEVLIPSSVTSIGKSSFQNCSLLKEISIPSSVKEIASSTFSQCSSLVHITISDSVYSIHDNAFWCCKSLKQIIIPNSVKSIDEYAFFGCTSLQKVTMSQSLESIGSFSFWNCLSLSHIEIPSTVISIGNHAFASCRLLQEVEIPKSVESLGNSIFEQCLSLRKATIKSSTTAIGDSTFSSCSSLTTVTFPLSLTSIGNNVFWECKKLNDVPIPPSVTEIAKNAFLGCSSLPKIELPLSLELIDESSFEGCLSLKEITIPPNVKTIKKKAFSRCFSLTKVKIPSTLTDIEENAFDERCTFEKQS